jgi:hypothetical protein
MSDTYRAIKADAQQRANVSGFDHGIERVQLGRTVEYRIFMLPRKENRQGHELRCEVVMCSDLLKCQKGHGPL